MRKLNIVVMALIMVWMVEGTQAQNFELADPPKEQERGVPAELADAQAAQDLTKQIEAILKLFSSLGGGGFVHTAHLHKIGGIDIGLRGVFSVVPDEFDDIIPKGALGPFDPGLRDPLEGEATVPFPLLHGSIGLPGNFEIMARFFNFPIADLPEGNVTLVGGGLKYGLFQSDLGLPQIVLLAGFQKLFVPDDYDFGDASILSFKGFISKGFAIATIYAGGGYDRTSLKLNREKLPFLPPDFNLEYDGALVHGTVGLTVTPFPLFTVNADYNFSEFSNFTLGVGVSLR